VDANQPLEIGSVPPTSLRGAREPSSVDERQDEMVELMIECLGWAAKKIKQPSSEREDE
jgi:hypothetical protein